MNFKYPDKGNAQGALEYILIIAAAIAISAVVLYFVLSAGQTANCESYKAKIATLCTNRGNQIDCSALGDIDPAIPGNECAWDAVRKKCIIATGLNWSANTQFCG